MEQNKLTSRKRPCNAKFKKFALFHIFLLLYFLCAAVTHLLGLILLLNYMLFHLSASYMLFGSYLREKHIFALHSRHIRSHIKISIWKL